MKRLLMLIGLMALVITSMAATRLKPYYLDGTGLDSVEFDVFEDTVLDSSFTESTPPDSGYFVLDDVSPWNVRSKWYWNGNSTPVTGNDLFDYRVTTSASGTGANDFTVRVVDTLNNDTVGFVKVSLYQMGGAFETSKDTKSDGFTEAFTLPLDSFKVTAHLTGYDFQSDTFLVAGDDTVTIRGKKSWSGPSAPAGGNFCTVYGRVWGIENVAIPGAILNFSVSKDKIVDSCHATIMLADIRPVESNDTGYFEIDLLKSSCMENTPYKIEIEYEGRNGTVIRREETLTIPADSTTYLLDF